MTLRDDHDKSRANSEKELEKLLRKWRRLPRKKHEEILFTLDRHTAEELFLRVSSRDQAELFGYLPAFDRKAWIRLLPPDEAADMIQNLPEVTRPLALDLLDAPTRMEVSGLLAYKEDEAGGLMNPRYARLRPDMSVDEALRYLREQTRAQAETIYYAYVLDQSQKLLGAISLRDLFSARSDEKIRDIMVPAGQVAYVSEDQDQRDIARLFSTTEHKVLPVLDVEGRIKGIVSINDVMHVVQEEATKDIQKFGGVEALDAPYFKIGFIQMVKKRAGWLLALFIGEMFTATAMGYFQDEIAKAVVLALFIPLIISSGGNSGSQASTLIIRAMALGEVKLSDWWRVFFREVASGLALGLVLGSVGLIRIFVWPARLTLYGPHYGLISLAVGCSLIGIVLWGSLMGSMLPFILKKVGFDPAVSSAPLVATLVDVTGLVIYFTVASVILHGSLL
jgi:magnesium transporter